MTESIPSAMRAIEITQPGPPDVLRVVMRAVPRPAEGEVLIRVRAAGVNRPDVSQRKGSYPPPPGASDIPGLEVAGIIVALGSGVERWRLGDPVCALVTGGGYAEYVSAPQEQCLPVPNGWSALEAAGIPETFFTVWINVFERAGLAPGETLLVHGGASGIGVSAIQMARALGHRVFVTAGTEDKCRACERLGAERAINYRTEDFVQIVRDLTDGRGVDVILDMVAGDYVARDLACLSDDGRLALIAFMGGTKVTLDAGDILRRRLTISGSALRARPVEVKAAVAKALEERIWPLMERGDIKPVIYATFPFEKAPEAHAALEAGAHIGKIILEV